MCVVSLPKCTAAFPLTQLASGLFAHFCSSVTQTINNEAVFPPAQNIYGEVFILPLKPVYLRDRRWEVKTGIVNAIFGRMAGSPYWAFTCR